MSSDPNSQRPIFILGVSQRSGTNYLSQLIRQHPSCSAPARIWEDFLVCHSDLLIEYADNVYQHWHWKSGTPGDKVKEEILSSIGDGLLQFLSSDARPNRLVTKTPDATNLVNFFKLFPRACLIVLVRDGRAVAESRVKTFRESYDVAMRKWLAGARSIISFQKSLQFDSSRYLLVRYEDLWSDVELELRRIFRFCGLDEQSYDYSAAKNQPVLGSSEYKGEGQTKVHWDPIARPANFNPTDRWKHWSRRRHELFNHLAGEAMRQFGYALRHFDDHRLFWNLLNRVLQLKGKVNYATHVAMQTARRRINRRFRNRWAGEIRRGLSSDKTR